MAYRKCLDDLTPDPYDEHPFEIVGEGGIKQLVEEYKEYYEAGKISTTPEVPWPTSEEEMLKIQKEDLILGPIIMNLLRE